MNGRYRVQHALSPPLFAPNGLIWMQFSVKDVLCSNLYIVYMTYDSQYYISIFTVDNVMLWSAVQCVYLQNYNLHVVHVVSECLLHGLNLRLPCSVRYKWVPPVQFR